MDSNIDLFNPFSKLAPLFPAELVQFDDSPIGLVRIDHGLKTEKTYANHDEQIRKRTIELVELFKSFHGTRLLRSQEIIDTLLVPGILMETVDLFFRYAHRHIPIIHEPTFDIASVELSLLLSIFLVGSVWSYPRDTYFMALDIVEMAEKCIFESEMFKNLLLHDVKKVTGACILPVLQAATLLVSISFGFPNAEIRQRFRYHRLSDLVSIARSLKSESIKLHQHCSENAATSEWTDYVALESHNRSAYCMSFDFMTANGSSGSSATFIY